jgi:hypothetical protein
MGPDVINVISVPHFSSGMYASALLAPSYTVVELTNYIRSFITLAGIEHSSHIHPKIKINKQSSKLN